jgi:hypothetical protein
VSGQDRPHEDGGAAAPDAGFDKITRNSVSEDCFDAPLEMIEARPADHRVRGARHDAALSPALRA